MAEHKELLHLRKEFNDIVNKELEPLIKFCHHELLSSETWWDSNIGEASRQPEELDGGGSSSNIRIQRNGLDVVFKFWRIHIPDLFRPSGGCVPSLVEEICNEVRVLKAVSDLPGFVKYRAVSVIRGKPRFPAPEAYLKPPYSVLGAEARHLFETRLFAVIETEYGGKTAFSFIKKYIRGTDPPYDDITRLECLRIIASNFLGVLAVLAHAEQKLGYRQNGPHLENIVVRFDPKARLEPPSQAPLDKYVPPQAVETKKAFLPSNVRVRLIE